MMFEEGGNVKIRTLTSPKDNATRDRHKVQKNNVV